MEKPIKSFIIDPKLPVRGVPFTSLRDLLISVASLMPMRYTDASKLVVEENIILSAQGESLKKSAFYHYWTALRELDFIKQTATRRSYELTSRGNQLVSSGKVGEPLLSNEEKILFREGMLSNQHIWENFFFLFTGQCTPTKHPKIGHPVAFVPSGRKTYALHSSFVSETISLNASKTLSIIFGLRRWGQQCDLIDEIFPPTTFQPYRNNSSFMYLVDIDKDESLSVDRLTGLLRKYQSQAQRFYGSTWRFDIPNLLTKICTQEGIRLFKLQDVLLKWLSKYRYQATIERPSSGLTEGQRGHRHSKRVNQSQPWLIKNNMAYTILFVHNDVLKEGR